MLDGIILTLMMQAAGIPDADAELAMAAVIRSGAGVIPDRRSDLRASYVLVSRACCRN